MSEIIRVEEQYYILATSSFADDRTRVLKSGETFAVFDRYGDIQPVGLGEQGIYHEGTRYLSSLQLYIGKARPLLLSSTVKQDNALLTVDLTNPDISLDGNIIVPRGSLHIFRSKFLWDGVCYERIRVVNYAIFRVDCSFQVRFDADYADIFEVRGVKRRERGRILPRRVEGSAVVLGYEGLDGVLRTSRLECSPAPHEVLEGGVRFMTSLAPKSEAAFDLVLSCSTGAGRDRLSFDGATTVAARALAATSQGEAEITSSNPQFNDWVQRSLADFHMMVSSTSHGMYPYAGVPWFSTIFGRDGIITALELLWFNPEIARGVLSYLAANQAQETNPDEEAEPGKILHEVRKGEMAALGEIPFGRYYGSVDATPLFVVLAGAYHERSGDLDFIRELWPAIEAALAWIEDHGDLDGDGFVEYLRRSPKGLLHQGWKDSNDSIFHADGRLAEGPIALCEVQAYVYRARRAAASLAGRLGLKAELEENGRKAEALRVAFERAFWSDDLKGYALALDGDKRPCLVRSSNAGQCLFTGIASPGRARRTADMLLGDDLFSGWGIRTIAASEIRYDPMSYHNGSVWPHDNALIAAGFDRYCFKEEVLKVLAALYETSLFLDLNRLPELFCGFTRRPGEGPTLYPVACSPQAWAAGAVFSLVQSALGLSIDGPRGRISLSHPVLPSFLDTLELRNISVGSGSVDLFLARHREDVGINVTRRKGNVEIVIVK